MKKQINEASVRIDVQGLESNDLETLSRMLALAGQAEIKAPQLGAATSVDSDETPAIMNPEMSPAADDILAATNPDMDDLSGTITDFGDEELDNGLGSNVESTELDDGYSTGDDDFDVGRMSSLAGIHESQNTDTYEHVVDDESIEESLLPDLSLDEDAISSEEQPNQEFGPFSTEFECVNDGQEKTNGVEGDNFIVVPKGNAFYWKRTVQEDADNRPESDFYDDESVDSIFESINDKYKKFMEGV